MFKEELRDIGWKGYREMRTRFSGMQASTCMRHARWEIDGVQLCAQHAGLKLLEHCKGREV